MRADEVGQEHVGRVLRNLQPLREGRLLEVEQGGPFEVPDGLPVPYVEGPMIPEAFTVHLVLERVGEDPLHIWTLPHTPVELVAGGPSGQGQAG